MAPGHTGGHYVHYNQILNFLTNPFKVSDNLVNSPDRPATSSIELEICCVEADVSSIPAEDSSVMDAISAMDVFNFTLFSEII